MSDQRTKYNRAIRALTDCLLEEAERYRQNHEYANALATLYRGYALSPGAAPVLHSIAVVYDAMGDQESATACRKGVIPEQAELTYFNAAFNKRRFVSSHKAAKGQHHKTHRPEKVPLALPRSNDDPRTRPEFRVRHTESRGSFVSILDYGSVWFDGYNTVIMDARNNILKEHIKGNAHLVADVCRSRAKRQLQGVVCFIDARSSSIYYHWMIDVLPKIALLENAGISLNSIDHFMVLCESAFQRQTLEHLGIPASKVVSPSNDELNACETLIVPFLKHDRGDRFYNGLGLGMARWVPKWLATTFVSSSAKPSRKLYISRSASGTRAPIDEARLIAILEQRGFACVTLESMSVSEQANLMSTASLIVAPHGAGLTNIAFCQPGTTIIELFGEYVVPCYWSLATLARLDYHAYFSQGIPDKTSTASSPAPLNLAHRRNQMINLDVDDFIAYIDHRASTEALAS